MPVAATTIDEVLSVTYDVFQAAANLAQEQFQMRLLRADEGGLAPPFASTAAMITGAVTAIRAAALEPGRDVALTVDVAASHFHNAGRYQLEDESLSGMEMVARLQDWLSCYPIASLEDGLHEEDWSGWHELLGRAGAQALILGDDLLCTKPSRIAFAI